MSGETPRLNPMALTLDQAARVLTAQGRKEVTMAMLEKDVDEGAPTNPDGTLNLVHYAAWIVRELGHGD